MQEQRKVSPKTDLRLGNPTFHQRCMHARAHTHTAPPPPKTNEESLYIQSEALVYFAASGYIGALSALLVVSFSACLIDDCRVVALFFFF